MSDEFLQRYLLRQPTTREYRQDPEAEPPEDDLGCFGWLRGASERAVMLELRKRNGNIRAVGYGWLERADFDPSVGITLEFAGSRVAIRGRNLNTEVRAGVRLFEGITRHRVTFIQESPRPEFLKGDESACIAEVIIW